MTETVAALAITIPQHQRLTDIFGDEAVGRAMTDFGVALHELCDRLLAQHTIIDRQWRDTEARWTTHFRILSGDLPRDTSETFAAIERAGRRLAHDLLLSVFGMGTGMRIPLSLEVLPLPSDALAGGTCPFAWVDAKLADPQRRLSEFPAPTGDIEAILAARSVSTVLQPIVRMRDRTVVGLKPCRAARIIRRWSARIICLKRPTALAARLRWNCCVPSWLWSGRAASCPKTPS